MHKPKLPNGLECGRGQSYWPKRLPCRPAADNTGRQIAENAKNGRAGRARRGPLPLGNRWSDKGMKQASEHTALTRHPNFFAAGGWATTVAMRSHQG